jgi:antitoxin ParD1/3/4
LKQVIRRKSGKTPRPQQGAAADEPLESPWWSIEGTTSAARGVLDTCILRLATFLAESNASALIPPLKPKPGRRDELEAFVEERVASGRFATAGEAVREGLRLLEERKHERDAILAALRQEIEIGVEQAKAGTLTDGGAFFEQLRQKIRSASRRNRPDAGC